MIPQKEIQERGLMLQVVGRMYELQHTTRTRNHYGYSGGSQKSQSQVPDGGKNHSSNRKSRVQSDQNLYAAKPGKVPLWPKKGSNENLREWY